MQNAISLLFSSRKFLLLFTLAIIGAFFVKFGGLPLNGYAAWVGGAFTILVASIAHEDAAQKSGPQTISAGGDVTNVTNAPPGPPVIPAEAVTKPSLTPPKMPTGLLVIGALLLAGCAGSQAADDAQHGFEHSVGLARCGQAARQAATDAQLALPSDAGAEAGKHARRVAALGAFDSCVDSMKEGGV